MPPELLARLDGLTSLSVADLVSLEADLVAAFDALYGEIGSADPTPDQFASLSEMDVALTQVREAHTAATERAGQLAAMRSRASATLAIEAPPAVDAPVEPVVAPSTDKAPVTASTTTAPTQPSLGALTAVRPTANAPRPSGGQVGEARVGLFKVAAGAGPHGRQGDRFGDWESLGAELAHRLNRFGQRSFESQYVATWQVEQWPAERRLSKADPWANEEKIDAVTSPGALVASGGVCNPVNVAYDVGVWAENDRPLKSSLPSFNADRGGLRFVSPPKLTDTAVTSATAVWPETTDATPNSSTKSLGTIVCATENEVYVDAIPTRLKVGNMQSRYSPEQVAATTKVTMAYAARVQELNLLTAIANASTATASQPLLGASRDLLTSIDLAGAAYRYRQRMAPDASLRVILPAWVKNFVRADITRELAHDTDGLDPRAITDAQIEAWLTVRNIQPTWMLDGAAQGSALWSSGLVPAAQGFAAQTAGQYLNGWPLNVRYWLFAEGSFLFLDGGQLNLGVVRDSVLDGTNDYETFVESFEAIAFRGVESLDITAVCIANGASSSGVLTNTAFSQLDVDSAQSTHGVGGSF